MATVAIMRMPDDRPNANTSAGINPRDAAVRPRHPNTVSALPAYTSSTRFFLLSGKVETIKVHDLAPGRHEVADQRRLPIATPIDFR